MISCRRPSSARSSGKSSGEFQMRAQFFAAKRFSQSRRMPRKKFAERGFREIEMRSGASSRARLRTSSTREFRRFECRSITSRMRTNSPGGCCGSSSKRLQIAAKNRERRAQFMRNVGHKIAPHFFHLTQSGDVAKQDDRAAQRPGFSVTERRSTSKFTRHRARERDVCRMRAAFAWSAAPTNRSTARARSTPEQAACAIDRQPKTASKCSFISGCAAFIHRPRGHPASRQRWPAR